ncbi:hypothetical protein [Methanomethylovorans sp.]|uniref:hypothetical protein n=1 Tax=Methanomethylovorans sp. TaxID=2758717 RepID=UPI00351C1E52
MAMFKKDVSGLNMQNTMKTCEVFNDPDCWVCRACPWNALYAMIKWGRLFQN